MERLQQQQHNQVHHHQDENKNNDNCKNNNASPCVRQSSTRWTPTTDQIRILKELYYNNGVRSPTADQIQKISVRLRQYGKIEGKNVFYWFQNHKARERQKKRLFPSPTTSSAAAPDNYSHFYPDNNIPIIHQMPSIYSNSFSKKYHTSTIPSGICSASSSSQTLGVGVAHQMGSYGSSSSVTMGMENKFINCSISAGESRASLHPNFGRVVETDPDSKPYAQNKIVGYYDENEEAEDDDDDDDDDDNEQGGGPELETLPLFPVHAEDANRFYNHHHQHQSLPDNDRYYSGWFCSSDGYGGSRASLELSLNSYGGRAPPDSA